MSNCKVTLPGLLLAIGVLGCSGDRVGVEGRVTYAGEPLALGTITFIPESEKAIKGGGTITNGRYQIEPRFGLMPGLHRVEIRWAKPTGRKTKNEFGEILDVRGEGLPDKYHSKSTLTATINRGTNTINFDLEK
jgi:hypothetical protein